MQELRTSYDQICADYHELIKGNGVNIKNVSHSVGVQYHNTLFSFSQELKVPRSHTKTICFQSAKANPADMDKMQREYQSAVDNLTAKLITTEEALMTQREGVHADERQMERDEG